MPTRDACLRAVASRDARFDGLFFTAVRTTGIYCRPSCPALTPRPENVTFHPSAAAAQEAGYRACRRCRPDAVPGSPDWDIRADAVARAMRLVGDGVVDREGVPGIAARLGYSVRQLQRIVHAELGASPLALARAQRAHTARILLETTILPLSEVAFAAGFGSIRSFNDAIRKTYASTPGELRDRTGRPGRTRPPDSAPARATVPAPRSVPARDASAPTVAHPDPPAHDVLSLGMLSLRLPFRRPLEPGSLFGHLAATAVPGVEEWRDGAYRRTLRLPHGVGIVALRPGVDHVDATLWLADPRDLTPAIGRCRRLLDLDADPVAVAAALASDPALAPLVAAAPGRRIPRTVDGAEFALRAVLGQQVSTSAARTQTGRLVARLGTPVHDPAGGLTRLVPDAATVAALTPHDLPGPRARAHSLLALARALAGGDLDLSPGADRTRAREVLRSLPGVGDWTVEMVALRALGDPDAFPAADLGVRRAAARLGLDARELDATASARWSPWRGYATQYLWAILDHPVNRLPEEP